MLEPDEVRDEVRQWLTDHWDPELSLVAWRTLLADSGWACPSWPEEWYGKGLPAWSEGVAHEAIADVGAVGAPVGGGLGLAAPTILAHGPDALRRELLRPILTGEHMWCQLFSEPGSGSDLAGLTTRAERDGDEWVINGQKVWNTSAHHAEYGMLLARTDWDVPKHKGISYFALPMHQPGVEVRPLRQMNRHASFNEVFLTDARVPADMMVGEPGEGWRAALTTLAHERRFATLHRPRLPRLDGRAVREAQAEADEYFATYSWYPQRAGRADLLIDAARDAGKLDDQHVRQAIAAETALVRANQWTALRAQAARALGRPPGAEGSLGKLAASDVARGAALAHTLIGGASAMLDYEDGALDGVVAEVLVSVPAVSIAGGTDQIQRNIIGEQVLGLPREPSVDRDIPFRDVPRNTSR
ncbi:MAG TPA: acyl-CoA dehydrogenase family protein [Acidimicrobiales bacterium]|nr:acyl-CoA dehydrogenase family protein [Acidimicrobiales bacterium]